MTRVAPIQGVTEQFDYRDGDGWRTFPGGCFRAKRGAIPLKTCYLGWQSRRTSGLLETPVTRPV